MGPPLSDTYGGKPVLDFAGEPLFAELVILRHLEPSGWQGAWIDTYRKRILAGIDRHVELPVKEAALAQRIASAAGSSSGCFDVFAWRSDAVVFAEAKRKGHDKVRSTQVRWVAAALDVGIPLESLLVVEWTVPGKSPT